MGCASSTPMVATAGSEMLKAATHVAGDVKKQGEAAVEDATQAIGATIDTAKETVSTAVAGITNELGNAFKDGTEALDGAKHKVLEGLHLETKTEAEHEAATSTSRAPTPAVDGDGDSLKTSTPEPEIERALANSADNEEEAPPTPKPSLQEMAELSAQVSSDSAATVVASTVETAATVATTVADSHWQRRKELEAEQLRPSTTEWEKFADQLAKSRKFKPYENFVQTKNQFSVYKDFTSLRDKPGHYDGHFSNANSMSTSASQSQSDLSSGHLTPAPPPRRHGQREYASFVGSEQPASVSRASSRLSQVGGGGNSSVRTFDFNPQRERISLPITTRAGSRVGSALNGRRSLWAREQPAVLPEEAAFSPVRRSSMVAGTGQRAFRDVQHMPAVRSTSNLTILPQKKLEKTIIDARSLTAKPTKSSIKTTDRDHKPSEMFKSLFSSSSDISSALLLATPLTVTSLLHSPQPQRHAATGFNNMPSPLASRAASFIAEPQEARRHKGKSTVTHATPTINPQHNLPPTCTAKSTPKQAIILQCTLSRTLAKAAPKCRSPCMSRASSRLSSNSSTEIVIRPLSHLNTPSAASLSPDHVVMTEYDDSDLEAALARLANWGGSTTTLHSQRTLIADSHRSSPWIRRKGEHKELPRFLNGSIVHLTSPAKTAHQLLERCEICCNEYVN